MASRVWPGRQHLSAPLEHMQSLLQQVQGHEKIPEPQILGALRSDLQFARLPSSFKAGSKELIEPCLHSVLLSFSKPEPFGVLSSEKKRNVHDRSSSGLP